MLANGGQADLGSLSVGTLVMGVDGLPRVVTAVKQVAQQPLRRIDIMISRHVSPESMPALACSDDTDLALLFQPIGHTTLTTGTHKGGE